MLPIRSAIEKAAQYKGYFHGFKNSIIEFELFSVWNEASLKLKNYKALKTSLEYSFQYLFNEKIILKEETLYPGEILYHYNPEAIKKACNALITESQFNIQGDISLNKIYREMVKKSLWTQVFIAKVFLYNRVQLDKDTIFYFEMLKKHKSNYKESHDFSDFEVLLTPGEVPIGDLNFLNEPVSWMESIDYQSIYKMKTFLIRRNNDNTLPEVISCMQSILSRIDPELLHEFNN